MGVLGTLQEQFLLQQVILYDNTTFVVGAGVAGALNMIFGIVSKAPHEEFLW